MNIDSAHSKGGVMYLKTKNKLVITVLLTFLLVLVPLQVNAFSNSLKNFVSNGKQLQLKIFNNLEQVGILSGTNVEIKNLDGSKRTFLSRNKKYIISPYRQNQKSWFIQVFATSEKSKAEKMKEELKKEFENYEVQISFENELYKVQIGTFLKEARAEEISKEINAAGWETWVIEKEIKGDSTKLVVRDSEGNIIFENGTIYCHGVIRLKNNLYNGMVRFSLKEGKIDVFNKIDFSTLQYGMLLEELPDSNNITALKAAAILNRSKALELVLNNNPPYEIKSYQGISNLTDIIKVAVDNTKAKVIYKNDNLYYQYLDVKQLGSQYSEAEDLITENIGSIEIRNLDTTIDEEQLVDAEIDLGLEYREIKQLTWSGPRIITIVDLNTFKGRHQVVPFVSNDKIAGLASLTEVVKQKEALVGINGGFYNYEGRPLGTVMIEGEMVSEPLYNRAALGITKTGEVLINNLNWRGLLTTSNNNNIVIDAVNRKPNNENEIILYNKFYGEKTPQFEQNSIEFKVENNVITKVEQGSLIESEIPEDGFVVKIFTKENNFTAFKQGKEVQYKNIFNPSWHEEDVVNIMGGGPKLITDGKVTVTGKLEEFSQDITTGRAPRTAVGLTKDNHLVFVTIDGRQPELSIGMTLQELAQYLKSLNVTEAMNLDGGDSSQLVIRGYTFNNPSGYRDIATGILIKKR